MGTPIWLLLLFRICFINISTCRHYETPFMGTRMTVGVAVSTLQIVVYLGAGRHPHHVNAKRFPNTVGKRLYFADFAPLGLQYDVTKGIPEDIAVVKSYWGFLRFPSVEITVCFEKRDFARYHLLNRTVHFCCFLIRGRPRVVEITLRFKNGFPRDTAFVKYPEPLKLQ